MKPIVRILLIALMLSLGISISYGQINRQVSTKKVYKTKISDVTGPLKIKKVRNKDFKDILVKDISKATNKRMRVAGTYFGKKTQRSWNVTPARAFGSGNLGFSMYSGQLYRRFFFIEQYFRGSEPGAFSGQLDFDARAGRTYLIKFFNEGADNRVYIYAMAGDIPFKVYGQNGSFPILIEAIETGIMKIAISARYREGQEETYPETLPITKITIKEL